MKSGVRIALLKLGSVKVGLFLLICLTTASLAFSIFPADEIETFSQYFLALSTVNGTPPEASLSFQPRFESPLLLLLVALLSLSLATTVYLRMKAEFSRRRLSHRLSVPPVANHMTGGYLQEPLNRYEASRFTAAGGDRYEAHGRLTIRGITRDVRLTFSFKPADGARSAALAGGTSIHRLDFGVGQGEWQDIEWVGNEVRIRFDLFLQR